MGIAPQDNSWGVLVKRLLDPHRPPRIILAMREEDVSKLWHESIVPVVRGQNVTLDFRQIETEKIVEN